METIMDEKAKPKPRKGTVGGGRAIGQKNKVKTETKQSMAEFFESLTSSNYRWRTRVKKILDAERGVTEQDFHKWSLLALDRSLGTPGKHQEAAQYRELLVFSSPTGYAPYDSRHPAALEMDRRSRQMNLAKEEELRMRALEAAKPADEVIIDVKKGDTEADLEPLESVNPDAFGGGGSRR
jgi:hypothetical protein